MEAAAPASPSSPHRTAPSLAPVNAQPPTDGAETVRATFAPAERHWSVRFGVVTLRGLDATAVRPEAARPALTALVLLAHRVRRRT